MLHFGIGCLSYEFERSVDDPGGEWAQAVETSLNALPSVEDVRVHADAFDIGEEDDGPFDLARVPLIFYPQPTAGVVQFRIKIPRRLHDDLLPWSAQRCGENFLVRTRYGLFGPSTFVVCLDDLPHPAGNVAVVVVREFLKRNLEGRHGLHVQALGPSPFHTDAIIRAGTGEQTREHSPSRSDFEVTVEPGGYARHTFTYEPHAFSDDLSACLSLHESLSKEVSGFYSLVRHRNRRLFRAGQIGREAESLVAAHRATGVGAAFSRLFRTGRSARDLGLNILSAEFAVASDRELAEEHLRLIYATTEFRAFREYLERQAATDFPAHTRNAKDVVALLEGGRTKELEIAVVSASTLLGGAAGAVAALVAGG